MNKILNLNTKASSPCCTKCVVEVRCQAAGGPEGVWRKNLFIFVPFLMFQKLAFGNRIYVAVFKAIFVNVLILVVAISRWTGTVWSICRASVSFNPPPTVAEKTKVKNLGHAATDSFISQLS